MTDVESERDIYAEWVRDLPERIDAGPDVRVSTSSTRRVAHEDGNGEANFVIELTVEGVDRTFVLMVAPLGGESREPSVGIEDADARTRARKRAASLDDGAYYGITDGESLFVEALDPDVGIEKTTSIDRLTDVIEEILREERRIKRSREFVARLGEYHEELTPHVRRELVDRIESDPDFEDELRTFLAPIGVGPPDDGEIPERTVEMLGRQATYLLIDKLLFCHLVRENETHLREELDGELADHVFDGLCEPQPPLSGDATSAWAADFWNALERKFDRIQRVDYEPIFDPERSPLNALTFADDPDACLILREVVSFLDDTEELSGLFDGPLLAKIYEDLIPPDVRWQWGQIYTPSAVARLITEWAVTDSTDTVLDPACGTGRFLVSAYERLTELRDAELGESHREVLDRIHGIDINQFAAHLATMSLVAMELSSVTREVDVEVRDFFSYRGGDQASLFSTDSRVVLGSENGVSTSADSTGTYDPDALGKMDAILMNPPYTRQEALEEAYKERVRDVALEGLGEDGNAIAMGRQAAFYVYFMTHATKFIEEGGRIGIIVQNSWMDARYGRDVQEFLLDNYRIEAILGTQRDRMIETADVNTVILFLERESDADARAENEVKFVQLKRSPEWFERNYGYERLLSLVEDRSSLIEEDLRIISRTQKALADEDKWGRFIRAPDVYFEGVDDLLSRELRDVADVSLGLTSGYNSFFYLDEEDVTEWGIEPEYLRPLLKSPKECRSYRIRRDDLSRYVLDVGEDKSEIEGTNVGEYVEHGEEEGIHERPYFDARSVADWYKQEMQTAPLLQPYNVSERHFTCLNEVGACVDKRLVCIDTHEDVDPDFVFGYLNSTLGILIKELFGRVSLGEGALDNSVTDSRVMPVLDPDRLTDEHASKLKARADAIKDRPIEDVYAELGADRVSEVSIDAVADHRRRVDTVLMEDVLDLSEREQLQVYRGVLRLVRDRIEKARSA